MKSKLLIAKVSGIFGLILVWFPVLATLIIGSVFSFQTGRFRLDYLMTAELFPLVILGGILLFLAAMLSNNRKLLYGLLLGLMLISFLGINIGALATGLASGEREPGDWATTLVTGLLVVYNVSLVMMCIYGVKLVVDLFKAKKTTLKKETNIESDS